MVHIRRVAQTCRETGSKLLLYTVANPHDVPEDGAGLARDFEKFAREIDAIVIPSGEAVQATADPKWNGPRPDHFIALGQDRVHFGVHRAYLTKCLFWIAWTGTSPVGQIPRTLVGFDMPIEPAMAGWIEEFAWKFYTEYARIHRFDLGILPGEKRR